MFNTLWKSMAYAALLAPAGIAVAHVADTGVVVSGNYGNETQTIRVSVADLDLRRDTAVSVADQRIRNAAERVCDKGSARKLYQKRDFMRCYEPAMREANGELDTLVSAVRAS